LPNCLGGNLNTILRLNLSSSILLFSVCEVEKPPLLVSEVIHG